MTDNKLVKEIKPTLPKLTMEQELEWLQQQKQQKAQQQQEAEQQKAAAIQKQQDPKSEKLREQLSQNYVDKLTQINLAIEKLDNYKTMFPQAQKLINQLSSDRNSLIKQQNTLLESEKHYNEFSHKVEENSINSTADNITASANKIADKITTSVNDDKITELGNELEKICTQELEIYNAKKQIDQDFERNFHKYRDNISQNKQAPQLNEKLDIANISEKMQIRINSEKKEIEKAAQGYTGKDLKGHLQEARAALNLENWWQKQQQAINETILSTNELQDINKQNELNKLYLAQLLNNAPAEQDNNNQNQPTRKDLDEAFNEYLTVMNGNSQNAIEAVNREFSKFNVNYVPAQVQQNDDPLAALNSEQKALYDEVLPIMGADNALAFVLGE